MNVKHKQPVIAIAVYTTATALLDLIACLLSIANLTPATQSTQMPLTAGLIVTAVLLIALAVFQWVMYFRAYVDFRIEQLRQDMIPSPSSADAPASA